MSQPSRPMGRVDAQVLRTRRALPFHSWARAQTTGVIRCDQLRALDLSARRAKKLERAPDDIVAEALAKLAAILEQEPR